jgi:hypothetical protein
MPKTEFNERAIRLAIKALKPTQRPIDGLGTTHDNRLGFASLRRRSQPSQLPQAFLLNFASSSDRPPKEALGIGWLRAATRQKKQDNKESHDLHAAE